MPKSAAKTDNKKSLLRALPSVDALLRSEAGQSLRTAIGAEQLTLLSRQVTDELRAEILSGLLKTEAGNAATELAGEAEKRLATRHQQQSARGVRPVINATGVILHTNLGRAPLSEAARRAIEEASGYCNLEFDLTSGSRGRRGARAEDLLITLTGTEAALVVNNCAAAALLVLTVLARDGETVVSRGELVEIGGDFRVPEVMAQSSTRMVEVGTTNRTKLSDYRKAITPNTRLIMRVHTSNYRIIGFTHTPTLRELAELAHREGILLYEDAGSGALIDFADYDITGEPIIRESFAAGADVISFSGDKLLGGPQAGLLVGRAEVIERMRSHPLYRALRADKLRIAALEATLDAYAREAAPTEIPTHKMIGASFDEMKARTAAFVHRAGTKLPMNVKIEILNSESAIGGGAAPTSRLPTPVISIAHETLTANQIEQALRHQTPPVISRIEDDRVLLDLRTVSEMDEPALEAAIVSVSLFQSTLAPQQQQPSE